MDSSTGPDRAAERVVAWRSATVLLMGWSAWLAYPAILPELQVDKSIRTSELGVLGAVGLVAMVLGQLAGGPLGDRLRTRWLAVVAASTLCVGLLWFALGSSLASLVVARAVAGLGLGVLVPVVTGAATAVAVRTGAGGTGWVAARLQAAMSLGIAAGPLGAVSLVTVVGADTVLVVAAGTALLGALLAGRLPAGTTAPVPSAGEARRSRQSDLRALTTSAPFWGAVLVHTAFMVAVGAYDALWARFLTDIGGTHAHIGLSYVAFALPFLLLAAAAGRSVRTRGVATSASVGGLAMVAAMLAYAVVADPVVVTILGLLESSGQVFVSVAATVAITMSAPGSAQSSAHGIAAATGTLAAASAATVTPLAYLGGGPELLFTLTAVGYAVVLSAGLLILVSSRRARS